MLHEWTALAPLRCGISLHSDSLDCTQDAIELALIADKGQRPFPVSVLHRRGHQVVGAKTEDGSCSEHLCRGRSNTIRIGAQIYRLICRGEATALDPDRLRGGRREVLHEFLYRSGVLQGHDHVRAACDCSLELCVECGEGE